MRPRGSRLLVGLLLLCAWAGPVASARAADIFTTIGITTEATKGNGEIYPPTDPFSLKAEQMPLSRTVGAPPWDAADDVPLRMPDTTGTKPNLAGLEGQRFDLFEGHRGAYAQLHFFGMTADGGPAGGEFTLHYSEGDPATVRVEWPDWCSSSTATAHWAIGPLDGRYRRSGGDSAPCGIFHVAVANPQPQRTLVAVELPETTTGNTGENTRSYLMALTLEDADGAFKLPDLSGEVTAPGDDTPPTTTHTLAPAEPDGDEGWYRSAVQLTLEPEDEEGGSGVEQVLYTVNGGPQRFYTGPVELSEPGEHRIEYGAVDGAGNVETFKPVTVKVDGAAPFTAATLTPGAPLGGDGWYDTAVTVQLTPGDGGGSGVKTAEYRIGDGEWTPYREPFQVESAATHTVEYRATDVAGNAEPVRSLALKVDATAPETSVQLNGAAPLGAYSGPVRVAFERTDGQGSGAVQTQYALDGGAWTTYVGAFDVTGLGAHRVDFRSSDAAGNTENFKSVAFTISAPPVPLPAPLPGPPAAPAPRPFVAIQALARKHTTLTALRGGRATVRISCQAVNRGTVKLTVTRTVARRLKLASTTLAKGTVRCGDEGRGSLALKPSRKVRRALARSKRSVTATLTLRLTGAAGAARDTQRVTFSREKS